MGTKTIGLREDVYDRLKAQKREGESFTDVVDRLIEESAADWRAGFGTLDDDAGFFVEDDGVGLSTTVEDDLFERGVSGAGGTGIGMAVVRRVADVHGWEVAAADPTPDRGARFVFET